MKITRSSGQNFSLGNQQKLITKVAKTLASGGLVIFPTETTYGALVDATNQKAVDKLLSYKSKREGKPLSVAVSSQTEAEKYVDLNQSAISFYSKFLPGPYTIVSSGKNKLAKGVESEFGTLGIRISSYDLLQKVLLKFKKPVTATSANASGKKRPYSIDAVLSNTSQKQQNLIDLIVDVGELPHNSPSIIIDTTLSTPVTLRDIDQENSVIIKSYSELETKKIASRLTLKHWDDLRQKGLVIGLDGELGVGKTIFAKGVAEFLQVSEEVTSPTYSYVNEYKFKRHNCVGKLFHYDVWRVDSKQELERLDFFESIKPGVVLVVEWWNQVSKYCKELDVKVISFYFRQISEREREISYNIVKNNE